jgi:hypothetical protein
VEFRLHINKSFNNKEFDGKLSTTGTILNRSIVDWEAKIGSIQQLRRGAHSGGARLAAKGTPGVSPVSASTRACIRRFSSNFIRG